MRGFATSLQSARNSDAPVISFGFGNSISSSNVGAMSARRPSATSARLRAPTSKQRHRIGGVRGVRAAGFRIAHHFAIAVIGGDEKRAAGFLDRLGDAAEPGIDRLHRLDRGRQVAGVADHVGIGVVEHDQIVFAGIDRGDRLVGEFGRRHFRLQIVGRDFRRRHHDAVLAGIGLLAAAVEEIRHVRIFLGLRHAQLRAAGVRHHFAEDVGERLRREDRRHELVQLVASIASCPRRRRSGRSACA